jgi:NADH dehydrogenase/NADH:ubiquinone oxidoreductase subunit G
VDLNLNFLKKSSDKFILNVNTHNNLLKNSCEINLPLNTLYEKDSLLINSEGLVQKNFKTITPLTLNRNSEDIFKILFVLNENNLENLNKNFLLLNKMLLIKNPSLALLNKTRKNFYNNFLNLKNFKQNFYYTPLKIKIKNFYMTDNLSKNSKTMSECSLFLQKNSNF